MSEPDESSPEQTEDLGNSSREGKEVEEVAVKKAVFIVGAASGVDENVDSQGYTLSPSCEPDDTVDGVCQNPEPPKELVELLDADNIGGTVFSKHWLFTTLMRLLQVCRSLKEILLYQFH
jgi:hypothetical protein